MAHEAAGRSPRVMLRRHSPNPAMAPVSRCLPSTLCSSRLDQHITNDSRPATAADLTARADTHVTAAELHKQHCMHASATSKHSLWLDTWEKLVMSLSTSTTASAFIRTSCSWLTPVTRCRSHCKHATLLSVWTFCANSCHAGARKCSS